MPPSRPHRVIYFDDHIRHQLPVGWNAGRIEMPRRGGSTFAFTAPVNKFGVFRFRVNAVGKILPETLMRVRHVGREGKYSARELEPINVLERKMAKSVLEKQMPWLRARKVKKVGALVHGQKVFVPANWKNTMGDTRETKMHFLGRDVWVQFTFNRDMDIDQITFQYDILERGEKTGRGFGVKHDEEAVAEMIRTLTSEVEVKRIS